MTLHPGRAARSSPTPGPQRIAGVPAGYRPVQALRAARAHPEVSDGAFRFYATVVLELASCQWHTVDAMAEAAGLTHYQVRPYLGQLVAAELLQMKRNTLKEDGRKRDVKSYKAVTPRTNGVRP